MGICVALPLHHIQNTSSPALVTPPPLHRRLRGWDDAKGGASCHGGAVEFFSPPLFSQQYQAPSLSFVSKRATNRVLFEALFPWRDYYRWDAATVRCIRIGCFCSILLASRMLLLLLSPAGGPACWGRSIALSPPMFSDGNRGVVMRACTVYPHNVKGAAAAAAAVFLGLPFVEPQGESVSLSLPLCMIESRRLKKMSHPSPRPTPFL